MPNTKNTTKPSPVVTARREARKAAKASAAKAKGESSKSPRGVIDPKADYTIGSLLELFGLGPIWFRKATKNGLKATKEGRAKFIKGADLQKFIHREQNQ